MADEDKGAKASDIIAAAERLFLDLIGTVVPGALLMAGWVGLFGIPVIPAFAVPSSRDVFGWVLLALAYVLGHFVTGFGSRLLEWTGRVMPFVKSDQALSASIAATPMYKSFVDAARERWPHLRSIPPSGVHEWRNIAMSLASAEENHTVYRFMFISLLNLGAGTVCILLGLAWILETIGGRLSFLLPCNSVLFANRRPFDLGVVLVALVLAYFFFERRRAFYSRALRVPFSVAIVRLSTSETTGMPSTPPSQGRPSVYLAGGMRSDWQDTVIMSLHRWNVIDPRTHHLADERQYTYWDLDGVRQSDWVLAHLEASNPGGYNLAVEVGYAKALGKRIILVDGKSTADAALKRYTGMLRGCADITPATLDEAITFLQKLSA